jgi:hypothetical protein
MEYKQNAIATSTLTIFSMAVTSSFSMLENTLIPWKPRRFVAKDARIVLPLAMRITGWLRL